MAFEYVDGTKNRRIQHLGYLYVKDYYKESCLTTYYKCSLFNVSNGKCPGRCKVAEGGVFLVTQGHNHAADVRAVEMASARATMKRKAQTTCEPVHEILVAAGHELSAAALAVSPRAADLARNVHRYRQKVTGAHADPADEYLPDEKRAWNP